jgi:4'-phosphopantetheinyl transferase
VHVEIELKGPMHSQISGRREIGIHVEAIRSNIGKKEPAARVFSAPELAEFDLLPLNFRSLGFFQWWTRKQAYIKARGIGMGILLDSFEVSLTPGCPAVVRSSDSAHWSLCSLHPASGYVGAVAGEGQGWGLRLWNGAGWNDTPGP